MKKRAFGWCLVSVGVSAALMASSVLADVLVRDDFTGYATGGVANNTGGVGWGGAWQGVPSATIVDPGTSMSGDRALQFTASAGEAAYRPLASAFGESSIYVSFLVRVVSGTMTNNDFLALWFDSEVGSGIHTDVPNIGIKSDIGSTTDDFFVRVLGTGGIGIPDSDIVNERTYHIVGHLYKSGKNGDRFDSFDAWLDPEYSLAPPAADAKAYSSTSVLTQFSYLGFRTANFDSGDQVWVDNIILGTTWAAVVPEPTSGLLLLAGVLGLLLPRRARAATVLPA